MSGLERKLFQQPEFVKLFVEFEKMNRERERDAAKLDPAKHKLSRVMEDSASYRYYEAGTDGRGREIRFCYACHRNVAGYFLTWREVAGKKETKRDRWAARKQRNAAQEVARRRQNAWIAKVERDNPPEAA